MKPGALEGSGQRGVKNKPKRGHKTWNIDRDNNSISSRNNTSNPSIKSKAGSNPRFKKGKSALSLALEEYNSKKDENRRKKEELNQKMDERKKALEMYKKKKSQKLKRMSKKTKKGQPIMKYWMESLLEKIQNSTS